MAFANKLMNGWNAFDQTWFKKNQSFILSWVNGKGLKRWFSRYVLRLDTTEDLSELAPHFYTICLEDGQLQTAFRTHWKYSKRVYFAFLPIWWALHFIDWAFLDKVVPELSFGFATLTAYPEVSGGVGNDTCDSLIYYSSAAATWTTMVSAATGTGATLNSTSGNCANVFASSTSNRYDQFGRSGYTFNTSAIGESSDVTGAALSLYGSDKVNTFSSIASEIVVVSFSPVDYNVITTSDYSHFGSTSYSNIAYSGYSVTSYNEFVLGSTGYATISKVGKSAFGVRIQADQSDTPPTWESSAAILYAAYFADNTGTTNDPKLVVTYSASVTSGKQSAILAG
jgi:hypothetical protein